MHNSQSMKPGVKCQKTKMYCSVNKITCYIILLNGCLSWIRNVNFALMYEEYWE